MDCILLQHPLFPHIFISPSFQSSFASPQHVGLWPCRDRWISSGCWAVRGSGGDADNLFDESPVMGNENGSLMGAYRAFDDSAPFGTLDAEITPEIADFFVSDAKGDPNCPSEGFSSVEQALNMLCQGKFVIIVDDENGDIERNLVKAASHTSSTAIAFMVKHGSGIVFVRMKAEDLERLELSLMSPEKEDDSSSPSDSFTITVVCIV